jgi:UV excision repair protein RAD23
VPTLPEGYESALAALTGMGFPRNESIAALIAAQGNPDLAYEFILTGIPQMSSPSNVSMPSPSPVAPPSTVGINQLRNHPQFNMLKQLIQTNPSSLPQVLNLIGQQNPALLQAIHENEREFLAMMNEPITETSTPPMAPPMPMANPMAPSMASPMGSQPQGGPSTAQLLQMLSAMSGPQRAQFLSSLGLTPEQMAAFTQSLSQVTPEQLASLAAADPNAPGGVPPGTVVLTHEEMEAINRLMALGFTQQQAAQAFLACDRDETLAANFLFENGGFDDDFEDEQDH